jgi:hypothetical protein
MGEIEPGQAYLAMLAKDHADALWLIEQLLPGSIHADSRCSKMPPPHVLTVECDPQPGSRPVSS